MMYGGRSSGDIFALRGSNAFPTPHPNIVSFVTVIREIAQVYVAKMKNVSQGRWKRGDKRNANRRKGSSRRGVDLERHCDLPVPVTFSESDAVDDSESKEEMVEDSASEEEMVEDSEETIESDTSSGVAATHEEGEDPAVPLDFSFEPGEYCDDTAVV
ncbi:unnamed protein product [Phytophthora lilii]|uniref:Unnamed protein product n=1 Tax=Phytophthora lilii TaxID=2077276 RepID=A0A9W6TTY0_9STRA|nr:unnamed protein product [Phytophthora lilii]